MAKVESHSFGLHDQIVRWPQKLGGLVTVLSAKDDAIFGRQHDNDKPFRVLSWNENKQTYTVKKKKSLEYGNIAFFARDGKYRLTIKGPYNRHYFGFQGVSCLSNHVYRNGKIAATFPYPVLGVGAVDVNGQMVIVAICRKTNTTLAVMRIREGKAVELTARDTYFQSESMFYFSASGTKAAGFVTYRQDVDGYQIKLSGLVNVTISDNANSANITVSDEAKTSDFNSLVEDDNGKTESKNGQNIQYFFLVEFDGETPIFGEIKGSSYFSKTTDPGTGSYLEITTISTPYKMWLGYDGYTEAGVPILKYGASGSCSVVYKRGTLNGIFETITTKQATQVNALLGQDSIPLGGSFSDSSTYTIRTGLGEYIDEVIDGCKGLGWCKETDGWSWFMDYPCLVGNGTPTIETVVQDSEPNTSLSEDIPYENTLDKKLLVLVDLIGNSRLFLQDDEITGTIAGHAVRLKPTETRMLANYNESSAHTLAYNPDRVGQADGDYGSVGIWSSYIDYNFLAMGQYHPESDPRIAVQYARDQHGNVLCSIWDGINFFSFLSNGNLLELLEGDFNCVRVGVI